MSSCSDEEEIIELTANAGLDQTVSPNSIVILDGSKSTGPTASLSFEWEISGPESIFLKDSNTPHPSFEPKKNGVYNIILRVTSGNESATDQMKVTVTGALNLSGTLTSNISLVDVDPDPALPDYLITSDLIIPEGVTLSFTGNGTNGITVHFAEEAGIVVKSGGKLEINKGSNHTLVGRSGWKGIYVDGGIIEINKSTIIENAGAAPFEGNTETAAISIGGASLVSELSLIQFTASHAYDLLIKAPLSSATGSDVVINNNFTSNIPIKAPVSFLSALSATNSYTDLEFIHISPSGGNTLDVLTGNNTFKFQKGKFYLDDDFLAGSPVFIQEATVFVKGGAGIMAKSRLTISNSELNGLDDATWKGIAFVAESNQLMVSNSRIKNTGSAGFSNDFFTSPVKAGLYFNSNANASFSSSEIINSVGYGIYIDAPEGFIACSGSIFSDTTLPAIYGRLDRVHGIIGSGNTFTMLENVPAVEVYVPNLSTNPISAWKALGGSNYYLLSNSMRLSGGAWTLNPGVNLKFKSGNSLDIANGTFDATGSTEQPITFDSEAGTPGTWDGILVQSLYKIEFCKIRNGGENVLLRNGTTPVHGKANIVFAYNGNSTANRFKNNTITGSNGYGILVEPGTQDPNAGDPSNHNTFGDNAYANIFDDDDDCDEDEDDDCDDDD
ncbi:MAG: hypothetical protein ABJH04_14885 [Cyclobacteriaceae bacterium]